MEKTMNEENMLSLSSNQVRMLIETHQDFMNEFGEELFAEILIAFDVFIHNGESANLDSRVTLDHEDTLKVMFVSFASGWFSGITRTSKVVH
jgi:hypothetical protein